MTTHSVAKTAKTAAVTRILRLCVYVCVGGGRPGAGYRISNERDKSGRDSQETRPTDDDGNVRMRKILSIAIFMLSRCNDIDACVSMCLCVCVLSTPSRCQRLSGAQNTRMLLRVQQRQQHCASTTAYIGTMHVKTGCRLRLARWWPLIGARWTNEWETLHCRYADVQMCVVGVGRPVFTSKQQQVTNAVARAELPTQGCAKR